MFSSSCTEMHALSNLACLTGVSATRPHLPPSFDRSTLASPQAARLHSCIPSVCPAVKMACDNVSLRSVPCHKHSCRELEAGQASGVRQAVMRLLMLMHSGTGRPWPPALSPLRPPGWRWRGRTGRPGGPSGMAGGGAGPARTLMPRRADSGLHCHWHACLAIRHIASFSSPILVNKLGF